ncbi:flavin reductase family protein [Streptomyces tubercidicus]|uniref:flavin reductase family protein n=1 Tax=Streptomyces tubercidicus TaxID=47759 RepID=UPI00346673ED
MTAPHTRPATVAAAGELRSLMARFPTGVTVVTAFDGARRPWGLTCSSLSSVTLRPPTLLICVRSGSPTLDALLESGRFAVNLLDESGRSAAELFASGAPDRFDRVHWQDIPDGGGPHLPHDAHAVADCRVVQLQEVGDHTVVFGEVEQSAIWTPTPRPLMYGLRGYAVWPAS